MMSECTKVSGAETSPSTPNDVYFQWIDWVVDRAAERGILVWLVPTWSRFVNTGWADGPIIFNAENAATFGRYVGARYPYLPKLIGGDSNPIWTNGSVVRERAPKIPFEAPIPPGTVLPSAHDLPRNNTYDVWNALARGIVEAETPYWGDRGRPFLTYHPCPPSFVWSPLTIASNFFGEQDWLVMDGCQSGHGDAIKFHYDPPMKMWDPRASHVPIELMWKATSVRPVIDLESHCESEPFDADGRRGVLQRAHGRVELSVGRR